MRERVENILQTGANSRRLWIGTFHSLFARVLRQHAEILGYDKNYSIYDADDSQRLIKNILKQLPDAGRLTPSIVKHRISRYKNDTVSPAELESTSSNFADRQIAGIYAQYEKQLKANNAMDFDDLITKPSELFRLRPEIMESYRDRFLHILIDEYQDTNRAQYNLVRMLVNERQNLCVVGDDDQSIYGWRGADIRNILEFERDFDKVKTIRLEQNYRSTGNILDVANSVVSKIQGRKPKKLWTERPDGQKTIVLENSTDLDEAANIVSEIQTLRNRHAADWKEFAVLYRTNAQSRLLEDALRKASVPYNIIGGTRFYERKEIKDLLAYLKVIANPKDSGSLYRIVNVPARGIGAVTLTKLTQLANAKDVPMFEVLGEAGQIDDLSSRAVNKIVGFHTMLDELRDLSLNESAGTVLDELLKRTEYEKEFSEMDTIEAQSRMENVGQLQAAAEEYSERWDPDESPRPELSGIVACRDRAGSRYRHARPGARFCGADDPAQCQGARIPLCVYLGRGGKPSADQPGPMKVTRATLSRKSAGFSTLG